MFVHFWKTTYCSSFTRIQRQIHTRQHTERAIVTHLDARQRHTTTSIMQSKTTRPARTSHAKHTNKLKSFFKIQKQNKQKKTTTKNIVTHRQRQFPMYCSANIHRRRKNMVDFFRFFFSSYFDKNNTKQTTQHNKTKTNKTKQNKSKTPCTDLC